MNPTFNTQALASSLSGTVPSGHTERREAEQVFTPAGRGNEGYVGANGAPDAVVEISAEGARQAAASGQAGAPTPAARDAGSRGSATRGVSEMEQGRTLTHAPRAEAAGDGSQVHARVATADALRAYAAVGGIGPDDDGAAD